MKVVVQAVTAAVVLACAPACLLFCAGWAVRDILRARNRVVTVMREVHTPSGVALTRFEPTTLHKSVRR